jgi:MATE family multidrug resistance protein
VAITDNLLPVGLFIYVRYFSADGMSCWNGFTKKAWQNWTPMVKLALPGVIMVEAEVLAFEVLTFAASYFGTTVLAAQSVLATLTSITFQIPFPLSIAGSTRVANLIGATLADAAKVSTRVTFVAATIVGIFNVTLLSCLKDYIPRLFTSDPEVIAIVSKILPLCAAFQLFDALAACCNGILRGLGRQEFGGYVQIFCYYVFAMPISFGTAFGLGWGLWGLWTGVALALGLVAAIELWYLGRTDWERSVKEARERNEAGG